MKPASEIRVIHVDDDQAFLGVSKTILSEEGPFIIETALTVNEALSKLHQNGFDVIVSDYDMPEINGLEFLKMIREKGSDIPFIVFTGKGREEIAAQALNLGADRYINKQGDPQTVYTELSVSIRQLHEKAIAEKKLWESEERFEKMVTNSKDLIMLTQNDGTILYMSPSCKDIIGYEPSEIVGKNPWITHPEDSERVRKIFQKALTSKLSGTAEYRIITKQGEARWLNHAFSQIIENGKIKQIVSTLKDITEQKEAVIELRESEEKFSAAFHSSGAGLTVTRLNDGLFIEVNDCFLKIFGYSRNEVIGKTAHQLHLYANMQEREEIIKLTLNNQPVINREVKVLKKDASEFTVLFSTKIVNIKNQMHLLTTLIDISELKKVEKALFLRQKELENFVETAPDLVVIINPQTKIIECNAITWKSYGFNSKEEIIGKQVLDFVSEADREKVKLAIQNALNNVQVKNMQLLSRGPNGEELAFEASAKPIVDELGNPTAIVAIIRDITQRKKDNEKLDKTLAQAELLLEKLSVVGGFVRHDIRNKLATITSLLYISKKNANNNNQLMLKYIDLIENTIGNITRILEFAQTYEAVGSQGLSWTQVNRAIYEAQILISDLKDVQINTKSLDYEVLADSALTEIFHNLIDNSRKHANQGQKPLQIKIYSKKSKNGNLKIIYEDNGKGIDPKIKPRLFSKGAGNSTGLGLYLIQRICDIYNWTVKENGEPGKNARFEISIAKNLNRQMKQN